MTTPHCIAEFTDPEVSPGNNRKGTVSYASRFEDHQHIPAIIMKGQWLEAAGFAIGTKIDIKVMEGCIVLTVKPPEPELVESLRQVSKLSVRKQKQVQTFIRVISSK
ncbi:endoribonuclease SymE [Salmonella enterica]|uniref:endoribonuclease SymE n=1 Tax=Salmonella enterica TaxID=28901 RepID=UPI0009AA72B2|nr:endoribonuclease SymE [Salmonella enterica]EBD1319085.1 endoribonuclease SymE [Salmonella enterica subsp. enterica serovar Choleraesuis]EBR0431462.1 endoribonuclease SymE [Salmonella enterica subsp. enterica serovar Vejle]EBY6523068.1 endoribonuclease SymE [Salmonella enterica subsp. enterica serovar Livingstone]ECL1611363.1 endoribonuclease SymE [Salmonella enterica subsp. enterica]EDU4390945.1 endoribonuclease SymE [Salmonella enterica subsp. enterica serovar Cuckmere]EJN2821123.1 endori